MLNHYTTSEIVWLPSSENIDIDSNGDAEDEAPARKAQGAVSYAWNRVAEMRKVQLPVC